MTTPLDEKGMEAARASFVMENSLERAIRAYLSTTPAPDGLEVTDLAERLRKEAALGNNVYSPWPQKLLTEAANALSQAQSALAAVMTERVEADNALVDKYRDPKTGHFTFPDDVAAIIRRLETAEAEVKRLTEANEQLTQLMLTADRFNVGEIDGCPVHVVTRGPNQWAVSDGSFVLNDSGAWEHERMPSSRSDAFIARTRFTFAEAIRRARATLNSREKVDG